MQFRCHKLLLDYSKKEWHCSIKSFLPLSNITPVFPLYVRCSLTISKSLQGFRKLALSFTSLTKFSSFLKSTCLLLAVFLKPVLNQKEKHGFIWAKTFDFLFQSLFLLLAIFLKFIFNQKEKRGFI